MVFIPKNSIKYAVINVNIHDDAVTYNAVYNVVDHLQRLIDGVVAMYSIIFLQRYRARLAFHSIMVIQSLTVREHYIMVIQSLTLRECCGNVIM
jgi:hypothetical protein